MAAARQVGWWCEECGHVMDLNDVTRCDDSVPVYLEGSGVAGAPDPTPIETNLSGSDESATNSTQWPDSAPSKT